MKRQWWKSLLAFVADHLVKHRLTENPGPRSLRNLGSCLWNKWAPTSPSSRGELCSPSQAKSESHAASALFGQCWSSHSHGSSCTPRSPRDGMSWMGLYIYISTVCFFVNVFERNWLGVPCWIWKLKLLGRKNRWRMARKKKQKSQGTLFPECPSTMCPKLQQ